MSNLTARPLRIPDVERAVERHPNEAAFEQIYRSQVGMVTAFFARRTTDPRTVADLTSETFVAAITSFGTFDAAKGSSRAWIFGIARNVYAHHCERHSHRQDTVRRLAGYRPVGTDEIDELIGRIDAERLGRALLAELATLSAADREVVELVDIAGLMPREAAKALGVSQGILRTRLFRARSRLRKRVENRELG